MPFKDILVAYDGSEASDAALDYALALAGAAKSEVTGIVTHGLSSVAAQLGPWVTDQVLEVVRKQDEERQGEIRSKFDAKVAAAGTGASFIDISGQPDESLARVARCYDVTVMGHLLKGSKAKGSLPPNHFTSHPDILVERSGRPLLYVPEGWSGAAVPKTAVIAWDGKKAAARAMAEALPFLTGVEKVTVLQVGDTRRDGSPGPDQAVRHLKCHGISAEAKEVAAEKGGIAPTILGACAGADLLIMGAYEHAKIAEDLFGGVTNNILQDANLPVLMAH